jgi:ketosteroid isomerase-like protein
MGAVAATAADATFKAATRALLRRNVKSIMNGDLGPLLALYRPDAVLTFPGEHSWGRTYRGRDEIAGFLRRFLDAGLRGDLGAITIDGPPWATRIVVEFTDHAHDPRTGERIYDNRAVIVLRTRWGRVAREEVYEDTQKVAAFDARLAEIQAAAADPAIAA